MATIRKRDDKYQVQIRRQGFSPLSNSFIRLVDAKEWARLLSATSATFIQASRSRRWFPCPAWTQSPWSLHRWGN